MKISCIGGGNMGITFAKAFLNAHIVKPEDLFIIEKENVERIEEIRKWNQFQVSSDLSICRTSDIIILAVKPQDFQVLANSLKAHIQASTLIISIMAGITMQSISSALGCENIIRSMPNLPSQVGAGITVFTASDAVTRNLLITAHHILSSTGTAMFVDDEDKIDASTAVSGSGPAYVYYFMNAMLNAANQLGFNEAEAEILVENTFLGALQLFKQDNKSCSEWISKVSSRGGTTEAAISSFNKTKVSEGIEEGVKSAYFRCKELSY